MRWGWKDPGVPYLQNILLTIYADHEASNILGRGHSFCSRIGTIQSHLPAEINRSAVRHVVGLDA